MLSSAHILAMDTKNLLDVVDSVRTRYPQFKQELATKDSKEDIPLQESQRLVHEITEQIYCNQTPPTDIGIYDNQVTIHQQLKIIEDPGSPIDSQLNSQKVLSN